jgi:hypothetical protein
MPLYQIRREGTGETKENSRNRTTKEQPRTWRRDEEESVIKHGGDIGVKD